MEQKANESKVEDILLTKIVKGHPIKITQVTLQAETFWPGKLGAETNINPKKYPHVKLVYLPSAQILLLKWDDGTHYMITQTNIKGMEVEE